MRSISEAIGFINENTRFDAALYLGTDEALDKYIVVLSVETEHGEHGLIVGCNDVRDMMSGIEANLTTMAPMDNLKLFMAAPESIRLNRFGTDDPMSYYQGVIEFNDETKALVSALRARFMPETCSDTDSDGKSVRTDGNEAETDIGCYAIDIDSAGETRIGIVLHTDGKIEVKG